MFPAQFDYRRAESVDEALDLLAESAGRDVQVLAGGQGIVTDVKAGDAAPDVLVDVSGLDGLAGIDAGDDVEAGDDGTAAGDTETGGDGEAEGDTEAGGGTVTVGALTTHAGLASSQVLRADAPVLAAAAGEVADLQIRNRGTIGGNLAEADPAADLPAAVLAADATLHARGPDGEREIPATEFFRGGGETALAGGELVTAVEVPTHQAGTYVKKAHPATGYAMVGVAVVATVEAGSVTHVRVAANGVMDCAVRLRGVESAVAGIHVDGSANQAGVASVDADLHGAANADADQDGAATGDAALANAAARASESLDPDRQVGDAHASAAFRAGVLETYVRRALASAIDEATAGGDPS